MSDQADSLRQLIADNAPCPEIEATGPPMIVVTGGKGGVGTTTVSLNLAAALTHNGHRTVLVDLAHHADLAHLAGVEVASGNTVSEVAEGKCSIADALQPGPAGTVLIAGSWAPANAPDWAPATLNRLLSQLAELRDQADVLIVDSGSGMSTWTHRLWQRAALVLLVTTVEDVGIMDAYATIKQAGTGSCSPEIRVLVNRFEFATSAADAERRIAAACRRFLGRTVRPAPRLPRCEDAGSTIATIPRSWESPKSPFGRSVSQLGRFAADVLSRGSRPAVLCDSALTPIQEFSAC
jgi:flagellar biosynthesis protein FlhG